MDDELENRQKAMAALVLAGQLADRIKMMTADQRAYVEEARENGATWRMVGVALGVTAQAAWDRYSGHTFPASTPSQEGLF